MTFILLPDCCVYSTAFEDLWKEAFVDFSQRRYDSAETKLLTYLKQAQAAAVAPLSPATPATPANT